MFVHSSPVGTMPSPVVAVCAESFGKLDSDETRSNLASRHDDRGFEV